MRRCKGRLSYIFANADDGKLTSFAKTKDAFRIYFSPKDMAQTAASLKAALIEARRAAEYGFTPTEYQRFKEDYLSSLDKRYSNKDKRYNATFYSEYLGNFLSNEPSQVSTISTPL